MCVCIYTMRLHNSALRTNSYPSSQVPAARSTFPLNLLEAMYFERQVSSTNFETVSLNQSSDLTKNALYEAHCKYFSSGLSAVVYFCECARQRSSVLELSSKKAS